MRLLCVCVQPWEGMNVLFVDDDGVNRKFGSRMLTRLKCACVTLQDGDQVGCGAGWVLRCRAAAQVVVTLRAVGLH